MDLQSWYNRILRRPYVDIFILITTSIVLGLIGGTPFYHPDFLVERALRTMAQNGNPKFFNYPSLVLYLNGFAYQAWFWLLGQMGVIGNSAEPLQIYQLSLAPNSPLRLPIYAVGHLITLSFTLLGVLVTWWSAFRLTGNRWVSLAAGLILATAFLWVQDSHFITVDTPLSALGMAAVLALLLVVQTGRPLKYWQIALVGVLAGLAASAKYNGALVLASAAAATWPLYRDHMVWYGHMLLLGVVSAASFLATSPFVLLDSLKFQQDFFYELEHSRIGHFGFTTQQAWWFHLQTSLMDSFGGAVLFFAAAGLAYLLISRRFSLPFKLALLVYPALTYAVIGGSRLAFQRYTLPLHPFIAIFAALGLYALYNVLAGMTWSRRIYLHWGLSLVAVGFMLLPNLRNDLQHIQLLTRRDTRVDFIETVQRSGLDQSTRRVFAGMYGTPYLFKARKGSDQAAFSTASVFIFDSFSHDRHQYDFSSGLVFSRSNVNGGQVIILNPYQKPRELVPLAVQSIYSPYLLDLWLRSQPGPYFEIYTKDLNLAESLQKACQVVQPGCSLLPAEQGFYYQTIMK